MEARVGEDLVLIEALPNDAEGVFRSIYGDIKALEEVGERPDVVLMAVGDDDPTDLPFEVFERLKIRVDDVDTEVAVVEGDAAIDDENFTIRFNGETIHADLTEAAERENAQHTAPIAPKGSPLHFRAPPKCRPSVRRRLNTVVR
jgi:hypothetical protein